MINAKEFLFFIFFKIFFVWFKKSKIEPVSRTATCKWDQRTVQEPKHSRLLQKRRRVGFYQNRGIHGRVNGGLTSLKSIFVSLTIQETIHTNTFTGHNHILKLWNFLPSYLTIDYKMIKCSRITHQSIL